MEWIAPISRISRAVKRGPDSSADEEGKSKPSSANWI